jgi:flagellin-like hook-associated protein FlgL
MVTGLFTLGSYSIDSLSTRNTANRLSEIRAQMDLQSRRLSTGMNSDDYAGLGPDRWRSVDLRQTLSALDGYDAAATDATTRVKMFDQTLTRMGKSAQEVTSIIASGGYAVGETGKVSSRQDGETRLQELVDLLNTDVAGRHLYGGRKDDVDPVLSADKILNGYVDENGVQLDGLRKLVSERVTADFGAGDGHVSATNTPGTNVVTLAHDGTTWGFGIGSVTGSGNVAVTGTGPYTLTVNSQPAAGEAITVRLTLPDGTSKDIRLVAGSAGSTPAAGDTPFAVGATTAETAASMQKALQNAITAEAGSSLKAASTTFTATNFFTAAVPVRVSGGNTVQWYQGDPGSTASARSAALYRLGDTLTAQLGAQANEGGPANLMAAFGALASEDFSGGDQARWSAFSTRVQGLLRAGKSGTEMIQASIGLGAGTVATAKEQNKATRTTLEQTLDGIEKASPEEAATALLSLQTQLQASYQTTSMLAKLSLVNYLG